MTVRQVGPAGRVLLEWLLVALLTSAAVVVVALGGAGKRADNLIYDALMHLRAGPMDDRVVVVAIDNRSLEELGAWPWARALHAKAIRQIDRSGAKAIAYDVLFTEPSAPDQDADLAAAMSEAGHVYLPLLFNVPGPDGAAWGLTTAIPALEAAAAGFGHVNLSPDADGVIRGQPLFMQSGSDFWPHLTQHLLPPARNEPAGSLHSFSGPGTPAPLVARDAILIDWRAPPGHVRTLSFVDVMRGETPKGFLKDKVVLVGAVADGMGDRYATPTSPEGQLTPGVEIQAALLDTQLRDAALRQPPDWLMAALSMIPLGLLLAGFLVLRPAWNMALGLALVVLVLVVSVLGFMLGLWLPPIAALTGLALAYPLWSWRRLEAASAYMREEVETFRRDGAALPLRHQAGGDVVSRQMKVMGSALTQLRDLGRFITDALHSLPDATLVIDQAGRVRMANGCARDLFDPGQNGRAIDPDALTGADVETLFSGLSQPNWRRFLIASDDAEIVLADGRVLKVDAAELSDADGAFMGHILRLADITAMRAAERQREQALQLLGHDMRSPQVSILTLLRNGQDRNLPDFARRIEGYANRTLSLAEGYVQLARAEAGARDPAIIDLASALIDAADGLWPQASERGVRIETPDDGVEYLIEADPGQIGRVLTNLIDNAIKYGPDGAVVRCTLKGAQRDGRPVVVCTVSDQGRGLSPEDCTRLFEPFHRADPTKPGIGLGLAFVQTVIRRHGGDIRCDSVLDEGSSFIFTLPRVAAPVQDA